jgi:hypothetical protein
VLTVNCHLCALGVVYSSRRNPCLLCLRDLLLSPGPGNPALR